MDRIKRAAMASAALLAAWATLPLSASEGAVPSELSARAEVRQAVVCRHDDANAEMRLSLRMIYTNVGQHPVNVLLRPEVVNARAARSPEEASQGNWLVETPWDVFFASPREKLEATRLAPGKRAIFDLVASIPVDLDLHGEEWTIRPGRTYRFSLVIARHTEGRGGDQDDVFDVDRAVPRPQGQCMPR